MATGTAQRLLKPEVLARLGSLELLARTVVDGVTTGLHKSPHFGFSQEFAEYRAYNEGDDLRYVDWNVYARTNRTYIKRFEGETNTAITLLLDSSASMGFGEPVSKLSQALYLTASLAYLAKKQHDAIGLAVFDESVQDYLPPSSRPDALARLLSVLERKRAAQGTDILSALSSLTASLTRRGLVVILSDFYTEPDELASALLPLVHLGQDLALFHVIDEQEQEPTIQRISALKDLESGDSVIVDPVFMKQAYRRRFAEHGELLQKVCRRMGADYTQVLTTEPLDAALQAYLRFRERRGR